MSMFSWMSQGKKTKPEPLSSVMPSSGFSHMDSTKPVTARNHGHAQPANRKHERMERREMLYGVVREAMVRAAVLSSSYKFKVLSLDANGRQFLVMVDLAHEVASATTQLAEIEAIIAQTAKARYDIMVTAVYWRASDHVAVGDPSHPMYKLPAISAPAPLLPERPFPPDRAASAERVVPPGRAAPVERAPARPARHSGPAPLSEEVSRPAELRAAPADPLQASEVDAFKKALNAGLRGEEALASANVGKAAPHNYTLLTGFEDTEMAEDAGAEQLSATQYGHTR